ncbi:MAG TPA: hypothetical protein VG125_13230 [Pirellulales bacterium]|nr:hypothetical protein [Pirellulales bacterium]
MNAVTVEMEAFRRFGSFLAVAQAKARLRLVPAMPTHYAGT